jgi:hypothetical protein
MCVKIEADAIIISIVLIYLSNKLTSYLLYISFFIVRNMGHP